MVINSPVSPLKATAEPYRLGELRFKYRVGLFSLLTKSVHLCYVDYPQFLHQFHPVFEGQGFGGGQDAVVTFEAGAFCFVGHIVD